MKSISLLAFAVGSAAASTTPTQKLRSHAVAEGLRFAKVAETSCDPSVSLETSWLPPSGKPGQERNKYVVKCNAPRVNPNTDELLDHPPTNAQSCQSDHWTILKSGFPVGCQWVKKGPSGKCRGFGAKEEACKRHYQIVDDEVFAEKLAELPDGYFDPAKMGNGMNGGEVNENVFSAMNGINKLITIDATKISK